MLYFLLLFNMNNAKTKQSGIRKCKAKGRFACVQNSNTKLWCFLAQNSRTILSVSMLMSLYTCRSASPESLSIHIVDIDTKTVTTVKTGGGETQCPCLPVHSLVTSVYTFIKLQCRSSVGLCLEELHAINDALGKHLELYENTQKRICDFFFNLAIQKTNAQKCFKPVLNCPGGVLGISSDGDDQRIFLGLKFSILGLFWV